MTLDKNPAWTLMRVKKKTLEIMQLLGSKGMSYHDLLIQMMYDLGFITSTTEPYGIRSEFIQETKKLHEKMRRVHLNEKCKATRDPLEQKTQAARKRVNP